MPYPYILATVAVVGVGAAVYHHRNELKDAIEDGVEVFKEGWLLFTQKRRARAQNRKAEESNSEKSNFSGPNETTWSEPPHYFNSSVFDSDFEDEHFGKRNTSQSERSLGTSSWIEVDDDNLYESGTEAMTEFSDAEYAEPDRILRERVMTNKQ